MRYRGAPRGHSRCWCPVRQGRIWEVVPGRNFRVGVFRRIQKYRWGISGRVRRGNGMGNFGPPNSRYCRQITGGEDAPRVRWRSCCSTHNDRPSVSEFVPVVIFTVCAGGSGARGRCPPRRNSRPVGARGERFKRQAVVAGRGRDYCRRGWRWYGGRPVRVFPFCPGDDVGDCRSKWLGAALCRGVSVAGRSEGIPLEHGPRLGDKVALGDNPRPRCPAGRANYRRWQRAADVRTCRVARGSDGTAYRRDCFQERAGLRPGRGNGYRQRPCREDMSYRRGVLLRRDYQACRFAGHDRVGTSKGLGSGGGGGGGPQPPLFEGGVTRHQGNGEDCFVRALVICCAFRVRSNARTFRVFKPIFTNGFCPSEGALFRLRGVTYKVVL